MNVQYLLCFHPLHVPLRAMVSEPSIKLGSRMTCLDVLLFLDDEGIFAIDAKLRELSLHHTTLLCWLQLGIE